MGLKFKLDPQGSFEMVTETMRYHLRIPSIAFEIGLFLLSNDPHDRERFKRRRTYPSEQLGINAVVRDVIAAQGDAALDWDYIHRWADEHGTRQLLDEIRASIPPID